MINLDRIDQSIIQALSADGRMTLTELAGRVSLSKSPCHARLKRLEAEGVIRGYHADISWEKLGHSHVAFVQVTLSDTKSAALKAFNQAVLEVPEIEECHMIAASFDYLMKVRTRDMANYREVLGEKISALPHVAQTSTFVAMEAVVEK